MKDSLVDVVHIGYPKTATTWLQHGLIPRLPQVASLGRPALVDFEYLRLLFDLMACNSLDFDPAVYQNRYRDLHTRHRAALAGKCKLLSFEFLTGSDVYSGADTKELLDRIRALFGDVKILITIREQKAMIESVYRHYVGSGGALHVREFLYKASTPGVTLWGMNHLLLKFRYDRTVRYCQQVFGPENVKVIPFELVRSDPDLFLGELGELLGVPISPADVGTIERRNESLSYAGSSVLRRFNQIAGTPLSDGPLVRMVPGMWSRFIKSCVRPLDSVILRRLGKRRRFIDKRRTWPLRRCAKRVAVALLPSKWLSMRPGGVPERPSLRVNAMRYLDWPDTDHAYDDDLWCSRAADQERIADALDRYYGQSNWRLARLTALPLAEMGYLCLSDRDPE